MNSREVSRKYSIISYSLLAMSATHVLTHVFTGMPAALFPILIKPTEFNLTIKQVGLIAAIPEISASILSIPMGLLSDKYGSKKMVLISMILAMVGAFIASRSINPLMFIIAVVLLTTNTTIYHPAAYSFTTKLFKPRDRPKALGVHGAGGTFGNAIGPIALGILIGFFSLKWRQVYLFWFVPVLLGFFSILRIKTEPVEDVVEENMDPKKTEADKKSLYNVSLMFFLVFMGLRIGARAMIGSFLPLFLVKVKGLSESISSFVFGSNFLTGLIAAPFGGILASRYGEKKWLVSVLSFCYLSLALAFIIPNNMALVFFYLVSGFFNFLGMAANASIVALLSPSERRGLGYALFFLPGSIMGAIAPIVAAFIGETFGLSVIFFVSIGVYIAGLVILKLGVRIRN
jgi:MFS family permease